MRKGVTKMYALFPRKKTYGLAQSVALAHAMLCVGTCNALREMMQCFASEIGKNRHRNRLPYSG